MKILNIPNSVRNNKQKHIFDLNCRRDNETKINEKSESLNTV